MQQLPEENSRIEVVAFNYTMKRTRKEVAPDLKQARALAEELRAGGHHVEMYRIGSAGDRERIQ